ncbi:Kelch repeat-containing protein [Kordiimonas aquimaris]|uniref:Kelch repeat-containing protein n=1 Tax=Kordiimonas aquimaris TaxID=707591 RepID=UPI0021D0DC6A|nr:kelch repeat-containing protein [Kordiimonas aquimaris]
MKITRRTLGKYVTASAATSVAYSPRIASQETLHRTLYIPRYAPALTTDGKRVLLSGGAPIGAGRMEDHTHSGVMSVVEAIDPITLAQTFLANAAFPRANHAAVWMNGQLWLLGGRTQLGDERRIAAEVERINLATQAIWRGPDLPLALIDLSAVTLGRSIFVFGGIYRDVRSNSSKPSSRVFECAPPYEAWVERTNMPVAVGNMATITAGAKIYLVGGFDRQRSLAITQVFEPSTNSWSIGPPPPRPLSAHAGAGDERRLFLFGDYQEQTSVLGFDISSGNWRDLKIPFTPRRHVRAVKLRDRIVVAGGNQSSLAPATNVLETFHRSILNNAFDDA